MQWLGGSAKFVSEKNPWHGLPPEGVGVEKPGPGKFGPGNWSLPTPFPTPWVDGHALGCNRVQRAATGSKGMQSEKMPVLQGLFARQSRKNISGQEPSDKPENLWETTVNRLVAGSNPARGAKLYQALIECPPLSIKPQKLLGAAYGAAINIFRARLPLGVASGAWLVRE